MTGFTEFERKVIDAFLAGANEKLEALRHQVANCSVTGRKHTGVGSFTDIQVASDVARVTPASITLGDVSVEVEGTENVAALLFVREGRITLLEFALPVGEWPADPKARSIGYLRYVPLSDTGYSLVPTPQRDPDTLEMLLSGRRGVA
jgi:hypothetical protein